MELAGYKPMLVRGRESNLKVTYPEDLPLAEFWLSRQEYAR
jgi:2-C-methyl-D-erythritol 4-phosphate cytidylyltransferase